MQKMIAMRTHFFGVARPLVLWKSPHRSLLWLPACFIQNLPNLKNSHLVLLFGINREVPVSASPVCVCPEMSDGIPHKMASLGYFKGTWDGTSLHLWPRSFWVFLYRLLFLSQKRYKKLVSSFPVVIQCGGIQWLHWFWKAWKRHLRWGWNTPPPEHTDKTPGVAIDGDVSLTTVTPGLAARPHILCWSDVQPQGTQLPPLGEQGPVPYKIIVRLKKPSHQGQGLS